MNNPTEQFEAANSPDTPPGTLRDLARAPHESVRLAVAANPRSDPETLASLVPESADSRGERELVRRLAVNQGAGTPLLVSLLERLGPALADERDDDPAVAAGLCLCSDARVPLEAIEALLSLPDTPRNFRKAVARATSRRDVLELLSFDRSGKVRKWALTRLAEPA